MNDWREKDSINILGIPFSCLDMQQTMALLKQWIDNDKHGMVVTANAEMVMLAEKNSEFRQIITQADLVTPDGIGILWAAKRLGCTLRERVTGIDLADALIKASAKNNWTVFFLGGKPGIAEKAEQKMREKYPGFKTGGIHHGYLKDIDEISLINAIRESHAQILLVAMGAPVQEKWISQHLQNLNVPVVMGIGGSFDVWAGNVKRAPIWMQKVGMEWLFRLICQPERLGRVLCLPVFMKKVIFAKKHCC